MMLNTQQLGNYFELIIISVGQLCLSSYYYYYHYRLNTIQKPLLPLWRIRLSDSMQSPTWVIALGLPSVKSMEIQPPRSYQWQPTDTDSTDFCHNLQHGTAISAYRNHWTSTLSSPVMPNGYTSKRSAPYWSNPPQSWVPECPNDVKKTFKMAG